MKKCKISLIVIIILIIVSYNDCFAYSSVYSYFGESPTKLERTLMKNHPLDAYRVYNCAQNAVDYAKRYYGYSGFQDNCDAFRHCIWSAFIKKELGKNKAILWTSAHEGNKNNVDSRMDLYNNKIGYTISTNGKSNGEIAKIVKELVKSGKCRKLSKNKEYLIKTNGDGLKSRGYYD